MNRFLFAFAALFLFSSLSALEEEELTWDDEAPSVLEYHTYLQEAIEDQDWWAVIDYADIISYNFPQSPFAEEVSFIIGEAYFKMNQLELANEAFTAYLKHVISPKRFEEAVQYKFAIAEQFRQGAKKPLFGSHKLPKVLSAKEDAIQIYDDVITTLPHHEIAVQALLGKAQLQAELEDYKPSLETLDLLIRRFPKHDSAAQGYLEKSHVYLMECKERSLDPALLDLADVNLSKFRLAFPREQRIGEVEKELSQMKEIFAQNLFDTGKFFEKTKKIPASIIYYNKVIAKYPLTKAAENAKAKLEVLQDKSTSR
jgi:outer membrane protein assembly factor BamD (BamD/ComL family)